jgi:hypothetical protein
MKDNGDDLSDVYLRSNSQEWTELPCGCQVKLTDTLRNMQESKAVEFTARPICQTHKDDKESLEELINEMVDVGMSHYGFDHGYGFDPQITDGDCPICMNWIPNNSERGSNMGATSRFDNETQICSSCGNIEGLIHQDVIDKFPDGISFEGWTIIVNSVKGTGEVKK